MFIDTSALISILAEEEDSILFSRALNRSMPKFTSGLVRLETVMALARFHPASVTRNSRAVDELLQATNVQYLDITREISDLAIDGFARFGKGQGQGYGLNLSDCMTYAVAKYHRLPILFKGNDFGKTDALIAELNQV